MRIVIIEDDPIIQEEVLDWLLFEGYETYSASNGREGVELVMSVRPDLIISDIMMPEMDGYQVLRHLQSNPDTSMIPFIFMSALADRQAVRHGMNLGADDYLTKPFTNNELLGAVQTRLSKHSAASQKFGTTPTSDSQSANPNLNRQSLTGTVIRGYQFWEKIGEGGAGTVYKAYQPSIGREVAIKVLREKYAHNTEFVLRFQTEAELVARLEHPHMIPLYDYWSDENGVFIVMRLLRGGSLRHILQQRGAWELRPTVTLVSQIADALSVAHAVSIVHRDMKPDNILLDERNNAYISDFGLAKNLVSGLTEIPAGGGMLDIQTEFFTHEPSSTLYFTDSSQTVGTPAYLSPEQIRMEPLSAQSDIYSMGITVYEMLTGTLPYTGTIGEIVAQHLHESLPSIHLQHPNIPSEVDEVLEKATDKNWLRRYSDINRFAADFRKAARAATHTT
jgi:CheY-like chemotaxis protein/tRNA A-37 threonylcarbamoyl transferase component Bud32